MSEQEATPKARGSLNESQRAELALFGLDLSAASRRGGSASRNRPSAADWVTLDETQLSTLAPFGSERTFEVGDVFFRAGDTSQDFVVVLQGSVNVSVHDDTTDTSVGRHESGQFLGELGMLLGQRPLVSAVATTSGRALVISPESFSQLMHTLVDLSDIIFREFVARRAVLTAASAPTSVRIIGESGSALSMALRAYAVRSQVPHTWVDITTVSDAAALLERIGVALDDLPVVITPSDVLRRPTTGQLAASLGVAHDEMPDLVHDLIIIGAGPAGLGAAVGGASEGLDTLVLEAVGVGGQAGASSRIENYVGFPNGVRGADLVAAATTQAMRLGARIDAPVQVVALRSDGGQQIVELSDHSEIRSRCIIIATGATFRRLDVDDFDRFEGVGVYYATTELESQACRGAEVIVVGGGNSAGQAALHMAQQGCPVSLVIRRGHLGETMSQYLVSRIESDARISILFHTEVRELHGERVLEEVTLEQTERGESRRVPCSGLFLFIGAMAATDWLGDTLALDRKGFILTHRSLPPEVLAQGAFGGREPLPFETSSPGVFAIGDVRSGTQKRVAAAVGEGSSVVRSVFEFIALQARV